MGLKPNTSYYQFAFFVCLFLSLMCHCLPVFVFSESCLLPFDEGMCYGYSLKWYFSNRKRACLQFRYRGCGGNKNRYNTKQHCEFTCQSLRKYSRANPVA
uniref:BPTI/Kunitz inhibitor domain-containing protein n=1 Tax=Eptatretus burgeri TaxID=7764 RepID=A0A8C4QN20_EPTBU